MKLLIKFKIILCLFFINSLFSQGIDSSYIQVDYEAVFLIDTANIKGRSKENTTLLISKKSSYFKSSYKAIADSLGLASVKKSVENPVNGKIIINGSSIPSAKFKPEVYFSEGKAMVFNQIARDKFIYESPYKILWKIENDTKIIQGYACRKATTSYGKKI
ncbi:GLPGLI family protein [Chryseobacterium daecheongense]|nr:GLPGLI family protein [Chryseobacterium daecheongense]UOU98412.1 GLPGLI family protein [Chryseobacterium daecheongense]